MPSWRKVILSGSNAALNSLNVTTSITASTVSASSGFTGSLFGTSSWANRTLTASFVTPLTQSVIVSGSIIVTGSVTVGDYNLVSPVSLFNGWVPNTIGTPLIQPFVVKSINYPVRLYNHFANLGDNRFFDSVGNNRFHGRSDLIGVSVNGDSFTNTTYARLFNGDYDEFNVLQIPINDSASVKIDLNRYNYAGVNGVTYPQGQIHALFYSVYGPLSMSIEYYTTSSGGLVTSSISQFTPYDYINQGYPVASNNYFNSWRVDVPQTNGLIGFTLFITASSGIETYFSELEYLGSRIDYNGGGNFSREGGYVKNINVRNNAIVTGSLSVSGSITGSNLSINGFPNVSASLASLSSGVGTLQQVTDAGNTTTNAISSSFSGVGFYGTASWAINVVNGGGGGGGGVAYHTQTLANVTWSFAHNLGIERPVITVYDDANQVIIPEGIDGIDSNNIEIYFPISQLGYATAVGGVGGGGSTNTGSLLTTASVNLNTITFTKGDGSTFPITVNTGSTPTLQQVTTQGASTTIPITASIISASSFTGSLFGTASWATNALTASFVNPLTQSVFISGNLVVTGSTFISGGLSTQYIDFDLISVPTFQEGRVNWVDDTKTLAIDTDLNGFQIEVGHQNVVRVRNATPNTILRGRAVFISGSSGNRPLIYTASWEADPTSAGTLGLVAADLTTNSNGYVISNGLIRGVNTTDYIAGSTLYLSSSGQLTTILPVAPLHNVRIGKIVTSATQGIIHVDVDNGYEIGELHDVVDTSTSAAYGSLLVKSGSVWKDSYQLTGSYGLTGSLTATSFTGSLFGTASYTMTASTVTVIDNESTDAGYAVVFADPAVGSGVQLQSDASTFIYKPNVGQVLIGSTTGFTLIGSGTLGTATTPIFDLLTQGTQTTNFGNTSDGVNGSTLNINHAIVNIRSSVTASIISASSGITGSLFGTASYALTASYTPNTVVEFTNLSTWTFNHNLNNRYVIVQVLDSNHNQIIPQNIYHQDNNTVIITFPTSESGYAIAR